MKIVNRNESLAIIQTLKQTIASYKRIIDEFNCTALIILHTAWCEKNFIHSTSSKCKNTSFFFQNPCFCTAYSNYEKNETTEIEKVLLMYGLSYDGKLDPIELVLNRTHPKDRIKKFYDEDKNEIKKMLLWFWFLFRVRYCHDSTNEVLLEWHKITVSFESENMRIPVLAKLLDIYTSNPHTYHQDFIDQWISSTPNAPETTCHFVHECLVTLNRLYSIQAMATRGAASKNIEIGSTDDGLHSTHTLNPTSINSNEIDSISDGLDSIHTLNPTSINSSETAINEKHIPNINCSALISVQMDWYQKNILHHSRSKCLTNVAEFTLKNVCFCRAFLDFKSNSTAQVEKVLTIYGLSYDSRIGILKKSTILNNSYYEHQNKTYRNENKNNVKKMLTWIWFLFYVRNCNDSKDKGLIAWRDIVLTFENISVRIPHLARFLDHHTSHPNILHSHLANEWIHRVQNVPETTRRIVHKCLIHLNQLHPLKNTFTKRHPLDYPEIEADTMFPVTSTTEKFMPLRTLMTFPVDFIKSILNYKNSILNYSY